MIKAAFFDVDGTLIPFGQQMISDQLREDLLALRRNGVKLFLATGRPKQDLETTGMLRDLVFDAYVTQTGYYCYNEKEVYRCISICEEDLQGACRVLRENPDITAIMDIDGESYLNQINDHALELFEMIHTPIHPVCEPERMLGSVVFQVVPLVRAGEEKIFLDAMPHCTATRWHENAVDLVPAGDGKAEGIQATLDYYGLKKEEIIAFGDGENDLSMIEMAGIGVVMENGMEAVKAAADYITDSAENHGVSTALRYFGLLPPKKV